MVLIGLFPLVLIALLGSSNPKKMNLSLLLIMVFGFLLRVTMVFIDPFLHDWDEKFHALVAKNLIEFPFKPMLRMSPILPFKVEDWCCNHVWLHKQPLFLWQMAMSMHVFGINEVALRIPAIIMGTFSIYLVYDIADKWTNNKEVALFSAFIYAASYYQLELTSGRLTLDQNDVTFGFYVTLSIWSWIRYVHSSRPYSWAVVIGLCAGAAVLNKWLTGLLIYAGWMVWILQDIKKGISVRSLAPLILSTFICLLVFLPWQLYIRYAFPIESAIEYQYNTRHIFEALEGHEGTIFYHFSKINDLYGLQFFLLFPLGISAVIFSNKASGRISISLLFMAVLIYAFFSFLVKTKMPSYVYPVHSIVLIVMAIGIVEFLRPFTMKNLTNLRIFLIFVFLITFLKPWEIAAFRSKDNPLRNERIENVKIYKSLGSREDLAGRVLLNCKPFDDIDIMFYNNINAYMWYPSQRELDSLMQAGYSFAAFEYISNPVLPDYIKSNEAILLIYK
jgi:4-amino-4-deoxy-L-arabinose transferase-like glycosyltransferase